MVEIDTQSSNLAIKFDIPITSTSEDVDQAVRISFYQHYTTDDGNVQADPVNAVLCT